MNEAAIKAALQSWALSQSTGLTAVVFSDQDQNAPRPGLPYATIKWPMSRHRVGGIDQVRQNSGSFSLAVLRQYTVSLNVYGDAAHTILAQLVDSLDLPDVVDQFNAVGFSHCGESDIRDLTQLEDTLFRVRAQIDLELYSAYEIPFSVQTIGEVDVSNGATTIKITGG